MTWTRKNGKKTKKRKLKQNRKRKSFDEVYSKEKDNCYGKISPYLLSATTSTASNSLQPYFLSYIPNKVAAVSTTTAQSKVMQV